MITSTSLPGLALARGTVDRADRHRRDPRWLSDRWRDAGTRVVVVCDGRVAVEGDPPELVLVAPDDLAHVEPSERWLLGLDGHRTVFAVARPLPARGRPAGLREVGAVLADRDAGLVTTAVALEAWHGSHTHCARCGALTTSAEAGMVRVCTVEGSLHHPRIDPAVIMTVVDDDDRLLLGHQARWPARRYSTLAGFVEPGESLEQAVAREVGEETGVVVARASYLGSQPWPFPNSLMVGFHAHAVTTDITVDGVEITDARWFTRGQLAAAVASGDVLLPPRVSIARHLIERWHGAALAAL